MQEIKVESCLKKHYYDEITLIRGILALLVVLGHITSQFELDGSTESNLLYAIGRVIYSFHMALFFVISGFVSIKSIEFENISDKLQYTKSRFERLMLPYFAMGIIYLPFKIIMGGGIAQSQYVLKDFWKIFIGINPDYALWFLYILFLFSVIGCWFVKKDKIVRVIIVTGALSVLSINVFWTRTLDRVLYFAVFYFTGIYIRMKYEKILVKLSKVWILVIAFISFVVCNIIICLMVLNADFRVVKVVECFVKLLGAVSGSYLLWCFSLLLSRTKTRAYKFWDFIGKYSMDIYMFAEPIKVISRTVFSVFPLTIMVILTFGTSVIGAIVCSKMIVRRVALLRKVFLGA